MAIPPDRLDRSGPELDSGRKENGGPGATTRRAGKGPAGYAQSWPWSVSIAASVVSAV